MYGVLSPFIHHSSLAMQNSTKLFCTVSLTVTDTQQKQQTTDLDLKHSLTEYESCKKYLQCV